ANISVVASGDNSGGLFFVTMGALPASPNSSPFDLHDAGWQTSTNYSDAISQYGTASINVLGGAANPNTITVVNGQLIFNGTTSSSVTFGGGVNIQVARNVPILTSLDLTDPNVI